MRKSPAACVRCVAGAAGNANSKRPGRHAAAGSGQVRTVLCGAVKGGRQAKACGKWQPRTVWQVR